MRHVPEGILRRLIDEPFVISDSDTRHLEKCARCRAKGELIAENASVTQQFVSASPRVADMDHAWSRLGNAHAGQNHVSVGRRVRRHRSWQLLGGSLSFGATFATVGVVVAGVTAAATLTTVFAPTKVAPLQVNRSDVQAFANLLGLNMTSGPGHIAGPSGSDVLPFGTLHWNSTGKGQRFSSLAAAEAASGLMLALPKTPPNGVGLPTSYLVGDTVTATMTFGEKAGASLAGSSLDVTVGPAIAVDYSSAAAGAGVPTLVIMAVNRPLATSSGASTNELETFLLSQPGVPPALAQELKLLGDLKTTLPVPTPAGANETTTVIGGSPAVVISDSSGAVSAVIWEDTGGLVHVVGGLLDKGDVLSVAHQVS